MLNHHSTVSDIPASKSRATTNSGSNNQAPKRSVQTKTPVCNQLRQNHVTGSASLLERQRMCAGTAASFPLYSSRIPLSYTLPRVYNANSLVAGGYSQRYQTVAHPTIRLNDVVVTNRSDVVAPFTTTPTVHDIGTPLTTCFRGAVNDAAPNNRCANSHWLAAAHSISSLMSLTTAAVTPSGETTTPRYIADSGIASHRRRQRATPDAVGKTGARRQQSRRSFLFPVDGDASDDSSSTVSDERRAAPSPLPLAVDALTKQPRHGDDVDNVADSTSMPTSDSAYSDADEVLDVAERQ